MRLRCLVLAGASFAIALFSAPAPPLPVTAEVASVKERIGVQPGITIAEIPYSYHRRTVVFGRPISLSWSADEGFLIATILLGAVGLTTLGVAARLR